MNQRYFCVILAILFSATCADRLRATDYIITAIPTGNVVPSGSPSINNSGTIAFAGSKPDGTTGIYTYSGGTVNTVEDSSGPLTGFVASPVINNNGLVAFHAASKAGTGPQGIYAASAGGPLLTIVEGTNFLSNSDVGLNDAGNVVFSGFVNGTSGIFTGNGTVLTTAVTTGGSDAYTSFGQFVSINSSGVVAFTASTSTRKLIATHAPGQTGSTQFADNTGIFTAFDFPSINDSGTVAFTGLTSTSSGIYTWAPGGSVTPFIAKGGSQAVLNNIGQIIYVGNVPSAYLMDGPNSTDVALGMNNTTLPILSLEWGPHSLNDNGQFVFGYQLTDGTHGIALGTPTPEPGGLIVAGLSAVLLVRRRTR